MCQRTIMTREITPFPNSPVRKVDPIVRAVHTFMYGLVVHFGTIWSIPSFDGTESSKSESPSHLPGILVMILLLHEYWVFLQHSNVFANPFCQHLDRQYGIALLKSNEHWAIAGTLSAYWCRETLGMFFCLPFLQHNASDSDIFLYRGFSLTQYLILYSLIYHTIKSRGVREDTLRRYSTKFGIMRLVIDKFYLHSMSEIYISLLRVFLQGFDTFIHFCIIRDLIVLSNDGTSSGWFVSPMNVTFSVWVIHAALNQLCRCSTASVMVQSWHAISTRKSPDSASNNTQQHGIKIDLKMTEGDSIKYDDTYSIAEGESTTSNDSSCTENSSPSVKTNICEDEEFLVRYLLRPGRVPDNLKGRQGKASAGVDSVIRVETSVAILASFFMLGLGESPFRFLSIAFGNGEGIEACIGYESFASSCTFRRISYLMSLAWMLWGLLYGIWAMMLKYRDPMQTMIAVNDPSACTGKNRIRSTIHAIDVAVVIGMAHISQTENKTKTLIVAIVLMTVSYFRATQINAPKLFRRATAVLEFAVKMQALRHVIETSYNSVDFAAVSLAVSAMWLFFVVSNPNPTPCEANPKYKCISDKNDTIFFGKDNRVADACFLGHPAELSDCWALWLLPYSLEERWRPPFWVWPLWPLHYVVGWYVCNYRQKLFGDSASFFCSDDVYYGSKRVQNWVAAHFGRHFVTHPRSVNSNIIAAARHAERIGVKVLCLGALNKAESINGGGVGVVKALGPNRKLSVIHGNHLTAAAVVETIYQCFGDRKAQFFLTGASSKVGWAVAQALRDRHGYNILCHSTDAKRREYFRTQGFEAAKTLGDGSAHNYWIVGKYDMEVAQIIPQGATAVVFSVPHPLQSRPDVRVIEAGTLHMDMTRLDRPRVFTNKLRAHEIFACHAASIVAAYRIEKDGKRIDEVGPVDPNTMDSWLDDAKELGFRIPQYDPVEDVEDNKVSKDDKAPVVIIGAGPSGLSIAAQLNQNGISNIILEAQKNPECFGSWDHHFAGLEVTSQKKWCNLPGYSMSNKDFPNETVTADEYQRYLKQYALRFAVKIRRGARVQSIEKGDDLKPWIVKFESTESGNHDISEIVASQVVVATGKHRSPMKNTSDDLVSKLIASKIPFVHSTEIREESTWKDAIQAARNGRLCVVGFGNSAADLATIILQHCPSDTTEPKIHIAARTIPPVFPRRKGMLRVDTIGYLMRWVPGILQDTMVHLLWKFIPSSRQCNSAFPAHLKRWKKIRGRVPVIDKHGAIASGFTSGQLVGHGPIEYISEEQEVQFQDEPASPVLFRDSAISKTKIEFVILATGYEEDCIVGREDRLNGLYKCGFGKDYFLPLKSIGDEAKLIAREISSSI